MDEDACPITDKELEELYRFVAEWVIAGLFKSDIIDKLIEMGIAQYAAFELVNEMERRLQAMRRKTIFVVMTDAGEKELLKKQLTIAGYRLVVLNKGEDAMSRLVKYVPDLILTDAELPAMSGNDLIRKLRRNPIGRHLPIFVFGERPKARESFEAHGKVDFIKKPYKIDTVIKKVKRLLLLPKNPYVD